jgi:hypothetical protein
METITNEEAQAIVDELDLILDKLDEILILLGEPWYKFPSPAEDLFS